jgi:hypothetical protein
MGAEDYYRDLVESRDEEQSPLLSESDKHLLAIGDFLASLEIDGLMVWLESISPFCCSDCTWNILLETADAMSAIGAYQSRDLLRYLHRRLSGETTAGSFDELLGERRLRPAKLEADFDDVERIWALSEVLVPSDHFATG